MTAPTRKDVDAMKQLMSNLGSLTDGKSLQTGGTTGSTQSSGKVLKDANSQAMFEILNRLNSVNEKTMTVIAEDTNIHHKQLASTEQTTSGVRIANYIVNITETTINGTSRNLYSIFDTDKQEEIFADLALYESVMAITKQLLKPSEVTFIKCNQIAKLDADYAKNLYEAIAYKQRIKRTDDFDRKCLYESKYSRTIGLAKEAKRNILKSY
jgi:light-regulated signal transduction histidine kinase (bacteriophytochrome)